jgi:PAS domain S-box-containing protein
VIVATDFPTRILIVDDKENVREGLRDRLKRSSSLHIVTAAATGEAALDILAGEAHDVVLCDLVLAGTNTSMSGIELVREIHEKHPRVRIVVFTGKTVHQTQADVLQAGAFLFLNKPVHYDALVHTIDTINSIRRTEYLGDCFQTLSEIAYELQSSLDYRDIARRVVEGCLKLGFDRARLYRYDPESQTLIGEASAGMPDPFRIQSYRIPLAASPIIAHIFQYDRPHLWDNEKITHEFGAAATEPWMTELELHDIAWIDCPLLIGNVRLGTLSVDHRRHPRDHYTKEDLKIMGVFSGLAAQLLNNAALYKQEALANASLRRVLLDAPDVVISTDLEGVIHIVSASAERITGFKPDELTGRAAAEVFTDERGDEDAGKRVAGEIMDRLRLADAIPELRVFLRHKQGEPKPLALSANVLHGEDDKAIGMLAVLKDLEVIEAQSAQYRELLEGIGYGVLFLSRNGTIAFSNLKASALLGREWASLRGCRLVDVVPEAERRTLQRALANGLERGEESTLDLILTNPEGTPKQASLHVTPVRSEGKSNGVVVALYGQEEYFTLLQWGRLADLGRMVASVAHEINNPLNNLITTARALETLLPRSVDVTPRIADYLEIIERNGQRIKRIVEQLREFARPREFQKVKTSLNDIIRESIEFFATRFRESDIGLDPHLAEDLPPIFADPTHLWQVFVNVLGNAAEAMDGLREAKVIRIVTYAKDPQTVVAEVGDTGPGIAKEVLGSLFDPFVTTKGGGQGTGLGLATSKHIIEEKHGGRIQAANRSDRRGALFVIELPVTSRVEHGGRANE